MTRLGTQVSGKYSPDNPGIFDFRKRLVDLGLDVRFPAGNTIIEYEEEFAITTPHERTVPFADTERAFFTSIGGSALHIVYNLLGNEEGYIGESTAVETIDAISHNIPTVWLRPAGRFSSKIKGPLKVFTERVFSYEPYIEPLDLLNDRELGAAIGRLASRETGIHPWSASMPRPKFKDNAYSYWTWTEGDPLRYLRSYALWPITNEFEEDLFFDIKRDLLGSYIEAWTRYQDKPSSPNS